MLLFDILLIIFTALTLVASFFLHQVWAGPLLAVLSFLGLVPVVANAVRALFKRTISVDLLASIALVSSLLAREWFSAAFITLMLAFARLLDHLTEARAKKTIQSLMKYHVEKVRVRLDGKIKELHVNAIRPGDEMVVESGERMPVDGSVISGEAEVNESSLTGESELVPKKAGDRVYTSTINENGSLVARVEKVGKDTTLARIISLVEEASRSKNKAERAADKFTEWYIFLSLAGAGVMYLFGLPPRIILSVLLVVCADDIAVAVPLSFTAAIGHAARRGVIVKGSGVLEQLSKVKIVLTDKTGTLTRGKPKIHEVKIYPSTLHTHTAMLSRQEVILKFAIGATESGHAVSRAILDYATENGIKPAAPDKSEEIAGQGVSFDFRGEHMLSGRLSFLEHHRCSVSERIKRDIQAAKNDGQGIVCLAVNGEVVAFISYYDELRLHARDIVDETKRLGVEEWHMLTGDNERVAAAVSAKLGITHFHANLTPEGKLEFIRKFERGRKVVAYIGDGVNDAASLSLADVSIAMGGIGADAAIEAADITIMKDRLDRVPEAMRIAKKTMGVMKGNFVLWAITNIAGLGLVFFGLIGPAGAATYNFLTDFIPIGNALRAGRGKRQGI